MLGLATTSNFFTACCPQVFFVHRIFLFPVRLILPFALPLFKRLPSQRIIMDASDNVDQRPPGHCQLPRESNGNKSVKRHRESMSEINAKKQRPNTGQETDASFLRTFNILCQELGCTLSWSSVPITDTASPKVGDWPENRRTAHCERLDLEGCSAVHNTPPFISGVHRSQKLATLECKRKAYEWLQVRVTSPRHVEHHTDGGWLSRITLLPWDTPRKMKRSISRSRRRLRRTWLVWTRKRHNHIGKYFVDRNELGFKGVSHDQ